MLPPTCHNGQSSRVGYCAMAALTCGPNQTEMRLKEPNRALFRRDSF